MRKTINQTHVEGVLYQHNLALKVSGEKSKNPGMQYINGSIDIATDDAMTNIVTVHFTYVTPTYAKSGSNNATFTALQNIINGTTCNVMEHGVDRAAKVRIDSQVGLNEFFSNRNGADELVSVKRNEGGFIHVIQTLAAAEGLRDTFKTDMIITNCRRIEADPDRGTEEKMIIKGYIFNFRNELLPVEYTMYSPEGMNHFDNFEASEKSPVFVCVNGHQVSKTVTTVRQSESVGWGETFAQEVVSSQREFVVAGVSEPYEWDSEDSITVQEYKKALQDRELVVADIKRRQEEYNATRAQNSVTAVPAAGIAGFNF